MSREIFVGQLRIDEIQEGEMRGVRVFIDSTCVYQQTPATLKDALAALSLYITSRSTQRRGRVSPGGCERCGKGTFGRLCATCLGEKVPPDETGGRSLPYPK